ncbi:hypothetical protein [Burkholderia ubonensis]|uniref:hypothetical protein n=1 Tax=Burkholderia ubonensis TaxID=101571 RepID=UPI0012F777F8|nr:hypothetical protein [Burkholderia ubonensis]
MAASRFPNMSAGSTQQFTGLEICTRPAVRTGRKISKSGQSVNGRPAKILNENPPASHARSRLLSKDIEKTIGGLTLDPVFVRIVGHAGMPDYECGMCGQRTGVAS